VPPSETQASEEPTPVVSVGSTLGSTLRTKSREISQPMKIQVISNLLEKDDGFEYTDNGRLIAVIRIVREMSSDGRRFVDRSEVSG
jgi:hypothetical protein